MYHRPVCAYCARALSCWKARTWATSWNEKARLGKGSKAGHLTYLGDAEIGDNVNIGAGTITCNYDGANKFKTIIGDDVFVGSDTQLVAPVTVGNGVTIAAGTTVTRDVADNELVLSRVPQVHKQGWKRPVKKK